MTENVSDLSMDLARPCRFSFPRQSEPTHDLCLVNAVLALNLQHNAPATGEAMNRHFQDHVS